MKKIKILTLVLAVLMLAGMATLFSSCGTKADEIVASKGTVDVDFSDFTVLYGDSQSGSNYTSLIRGQFDAFLAKLIDATGVNMKMQAASRKDADADAKEILIGATDREESTKALKKIKGDGFIISVEKNKIVIVGTNNLFTVMAMNYFADTYLTGNEKASKTLTINETVKANEMSSIVLGDSTIDKKDTSGAYTYVYKNGLGMTPDAYANLKTDVSQPHYKEFPMIAAEKFAQNMSTAVKLDLAHFPVGNDATTSEREVLIGHTAREESRNALAKIDETQYILAVVGDRVVVNAWSNAVLSQASDAYLDLVKEATVKNGSDVKITLPRNLTLIGEAEHTWVTDFPKPESENVVLYNTMDNNDSSLQYLYRGEGVTKEAYDAYCAQLKAAGYKEYQSNTVEGSIFKVFTNKGRDVALYVAYNAYSHKDDFEEFDWTISKQIDSKVLDPYGFDSSIRIISSTIENAYLPSTELLNAQYYDYVTATEMTSMPIYHKAVGHCIIFTLEDGTFIVYDGGGEQAGSREYDTLMNVLRELNAQVTGEPTSSSNPIRISAWILSHAHWDHYQGFRRMLEYYGKTGEISMKYMIANIPSKEAYCSDDFEEVANVMTPDDIKKMQASVNGGFTYIKLHTGMKMHLANIEIETMVTWEDLNPMQVPNTNDTNTVLRFTISSQNSANKTTLMLLGDANRNQSRFMCATFGTYLKSDMSTVAHHGNAGCEIDLYEMIDPETLFWTHHAGAAQDYLNPAKAGTWNYQVDQYFAYTLASVKRIFAIGGPQMFYVSGDTSDAEKIATGEMPGRDGYIHLTFVDGKPNFDNVQQFHFTYTKNSKGQWIIETVSSSALEHTDISGGADAWAANKNVMTFVSNYMVKCNTSCPTGQHAH